MIAMPGLIKMPVLLAATHGTTAYWYVTRSAGLVSLVLLTAVMILGILTSLGWSSPKWPRFLSPALHRNLSLFCLGLIVLHVVTTVADGFAPIGLLDGILPFHSPYRPFWISLGAISFDLLLVLGVTSAFRHRIGYWTWKAVHWIAYLSWPLAVLHGLGTGTDAHLPPIFFLNALCALAVLVAILWRLGAGLPDRAEQRILAGGASLVAVLAIGIFAVLGPLQPGWSRRAGTPLSLLGSSSVAPLTPTATSSTVPTGGANATSAPSAIPNAPFTASLSASFSTSAPDAADLVTVAIQGQLSGGVSLPFRLAIQGTPQGGGVSMTSSQLTVGTSTGQVTSLSGDQLKAVLNNADGTTTAVTIQLTLHQRSGTATGTVQGSPGGSG